MSKNNDPTYNLLLAALSSNEIAALGELETVKLEVMQVLETPGQPIPAVYFPRSGLVSVVAQSATGDGTEINMIGFEGMTGTSLLMGIDRAVNQTLVQSGGYALRLPVVALQAAMASRPNIATTFRRYLHVLIVQASQAAVASGSGLTNQRLARWLLMRHDRSRRMELSVTHAFLGVLLGVRRPSVTLAMHTLEQRGLVRTKRGTIEVLDRAGLEDAANGYYGVPEAEYARVFCSV